MQFFDWLKGSGWRCRSTILPLRRRQRPLPDKAILITFDDGYRASTRVFPLLKVYRYPIVAALVGI